MHSWVCLQCILMVAGHSYLETVRQFAKPLVEVADLRPTSAEESKVARVNEYLAQRNFKLAMEFVRVSDADDSNGSGAPSRWFCSHENQSRAHESALAYSLCPQFTKAHSRKSGSSIPTCGSISFPH